MKKKFQTPNFGRFIVAPEGIEQGQKCQFNRKSCEREVLYQELLNPKSGRIVRSGRFLCEYHAEKVRQKYGLEKR